MFELHLRCPQDSVEPLSDALEALDALSVSVEDADALTADEQPLFGEPGTEPQQLAWNRSTLTALFARREQAEEAWKLLAVQDFAAGSQLEEIREVPEADWVGLTQSQFQPVEITPEFWIVPSWHEVPAQARLSIELDPGMAFGTGTHPTTRMCLRWLAQHAQQRGGTLEAEVLDYGCGSGILAIAAAKLGAQAVDAVDIDEAAIAATIRNAETNEVALRSGTPEIAKPAYHIVLANILANPLQVLAPLLCSHVAPGGHLVLAGILERQAEQLQQAYAPWLELSVSDSEEGWILMTARKKLADGAVQAQ